MLATHPQTPVDHMALLMLQSHRCSPHCQIASGWTTDAQGLLSHDCMTVLLLQTQTETQVAVSLPQAPRIEPCECGAALKGSSCSWRSYPTSDVITVIRGDASRAGWLFTGWNSTRNNLCPALLGKDSFGALMRWHSIHEMAKYSWDGKVFMKWQSIHKMAKYLWDGKVFMRWQSIHEMAKYTWDGKVFMRWQSIHEMAKYLWDGKVYMRWQSIHEMAKYTWDGKVYMRWQSIHEMAKYTWDGKVYMRRQSIHEMAKYTWDGKVHITADTVLYIQALEITFLFFSFFRKGYVEGGGEGQVQKR